MVKEDGFSDLPDSILLHILSLLPDKKQVVRSSVLSKQWQFLWNSVPLSLHFSSENCESDQDILDFVTSTNRELHYCRSFKRILKFMVVFEYGEQYAKDVDLWVHFATQVANVEDFTLQLYDGSNYEFPQFAYKSTSLTNLVLWMCQLNPSGSVNWSSLVTLSIWKMKLTESVMEKVLSGCPNLECLDLDSFWGIHHLKISSEKLRKLIITSCRMDLLEISAPHVQNLHILESCGEKRLLLSNVASLVTAVLDFEILEFDDEDGQDKLEKVGRYFKELLHSVAHVENLELCPLCIEILCLLELQGWPSPPSRRKFLKLNTALEHLDFPGLCSLLKSSSDLETMVIDWENGNPGRSLSRFTNENEDTRRFQTHNCNYSLLHLKTIKIIHFPGPLSENKFILPLVKYLLKNATVLEKLVISAEFEGSDVYWDYAEMAHELLSFPRSSPHASVVFSCQ